jgi:hypothetical protein
MPRCRECDPCEDCGIRDSFLTERKGETKMSDIATKLQAANEILKTQGQDGNWNSNAYMFGMYNGMECILAIIEDREPQYRELAENPEGNSEPNTHYPEDDEPYDDEPYDGGDLDEPSDDFADIEDIEVDPEFCN